MRGPWAARDGVVGKGGDINRCEVSEEASHVKSWEMWFGSPENKCQASQWEHGWLFGGTVRMLCGRNRMSERVIKK